MSGSSRLDLGEVLWSLPRRGAIALIRVYQLLISPMLGPRCRFYPSCSRYACACLADHGFVRGSWLTLRRLSRCHPWHPGGYDPPPPVLSGANCSEHAPERQDAPTTVEVSNGLTDPGA